MKAVSLLLLLLLAAPCLGQPGPLVVILLPGTSLRDWRAADAPNLHHLMATGALAVMNTRTARLSNDRTRDSKARETPESALLTLGAGSRAAAGKEEAIFLPSKIAGALYARRMGIFAPSGTMVSVGWPALLRANSGLGYDVDLGNLADALAAIRVPIRAGGGNFAGLAAASGEGTVVPVSSPDNILEGCTIWDAGSDIKAADSLIGQAATQALARHGRLIVLSPFANDTDYGKGRRLTPLLEYGQDVGIGLLRSDSTRHPGLVTNTDFAPSVAGYFGLKREDFPALPFGYSWNALPSTNAERQVSALEEQSYQQARGIQILPYLAVTLAFWMLLGTALAMNLRLPVWGLCIPLTAALALLPAGSAMEAGAWFIALTLTGLFVASRRGDQAVIAALTAGIVLLLILDMATGSHLMQRSLLGYSAVEGARYYGIGNEAMGLLIGSALVLAARLWPLGRLQRVSTLAFLTTLALLLGSPLAGAKAGGLLVSVAAFGTFVWESYGGKWSWRIIITLMAVTVGSLGIVALSDAIFFPGHHSHMGEAVRRIQGGGFAEAKDIMTRKLAVEGWLAWHSAWACLLWIGLVCLWQLRRLSFPSRTPLNVAGLVAVVICLLLNDAGVVAAALCLVPLWCEAALRAKTEQPWAKAASPRAVR